MMYNMSMLRHWSSNERRGGGALNHLPLLFCKSVYCLSFLKLGTDHYPPPPPHRDWGKIVCMKKIAEISCLLQLNCLHEKNC